MFKALYNLLMEDTSEIVVKLEEPKEIIVEETTGLSETAQVLIDTYPKEVIEIHNAFNNEADRLAKQAQELLESIKPVEPTAIDKSKLAAKFGFNSIQEVQEVRQNKRDRDSQLRELKTYQEAKEFLPNCKWIPKSSVTRICKEYNLVLGEVKQYKGFLPLKNLLEIEEFSNKYRDKFIAWYDFEWPVYVKYKDPKSKDYEKTNMLDRLKICAPIKDMDTRGYSVNSNKELVKNVPDPIVLVERSFNDKEGYFIITAWGDEASDPEVIGYNQ